ncbi:ISPsy6, transposase [Marinobacterium lacunae]|uniref:ISPsy6, transposase n=1 Tax=Marinobacterium lacunae TaxID=1232683 RepID=A0A081FWT2_9GAMM|nr:ISPsy6, transposase [Marinobacterium lacunae]
MVLIQGKGQPEKVRAHIERFEKHIEHYLARLDQADAADFYREDEVTVAQKISWMKQRISELRIIEDQVNRHPEKQVSTTDPDSRLLKTEGMTRQVCYNVQSAVDTKHHLIVAHEVTNTNDRGQLPWLAQSALANNEITVIANKGYYSRQDIKEAQDTGVSALVPKGDTSGAEKNGIFNKSLFCYEQERDLYICPAGQELQ